MPTTINKDIRTAGGGDYTTCQAFEDAFPAAGFVAADEQWNGFLYGEDVTTTFNAQVMNVSAHTADSTRYWTLQNGTNEGIIDQPSSALRYRGSEGAALKSDNSGGSNVAIFISGVNNFFRLIGLQCFSQRSAISFDADCSDWSIDRCVFEGGTGGAGTPTFISDTGGTVQRSAFILDRDSDNITNIGTSGTDGLKFYHCHFVRPSNRTAGGYACNILGGGTTSHEFKNCFFGGVAANSFNTSTGITISYCGSTATIISGSNNQPSLTYANQVEQPSSASGLHDFRMKSGATLDGNGNAIGGITTDFYAVTFDSPPAIGPMELAAGGAAATPRLMLLGVG